MLILDAWLIGLVASLSRVYLQALLMRLVYLKGQSGRSFVTTSMSLKNYIPARGDIVWLHFDLSAGKKMKDHHMALVVSHIILNEKTGRTIVCPITSKVK